MRAVIQRVNSGCVSVNNKVIAQIDKGLVILLGVAKKDTSKETQALVKKILELRIFSDQDKKMNLNAQEVNAQFLVVSQFTLCAQLAGGRRPSFDPAAPWELAQKLYLEFIQCLKQSQLKVEQGAFKEYMSVNIENDGPVTFILDTERGL